MWLSGLHLQHIFSNVAGCPAPGRYVDLFNEHLIFFLWGKSFPKRRSDQNNQSDTILRAYYNADWILNNLSIQIDIQFWTQLWPWDTNNHSPEQGTKSCWEKKNRSDTVQFWVLIDDDSNITEETPNLVMHAVLKNQFYSYYRYMLYTFNIIQIIWNENRTSWCVRCWSVYSISITDTCSWYCNMLYT